MKHTSFRAALLITLAAIAFSAVPAHAVTWLTVNGATSGSITTPGWVELRSDTSAVGAKVRFVAGSDVNGNGRLDAGEPVSVALGTVTDGGWTDEDSTSRTVRLAHHVVSRLRGPMVIAAVDDDGTVVAHSYSFSYTSPGQSVSGTVLYDNGSPAVGIMVGVMMGTNGSFCCTDAGGNYTLYLPSGSNAVGIILNAGNPAPTQRGIPALAWIQLGTSEAKTGVNFIMTTGSGPAIVGAVTEGSPPSPGGMSRAAGRAVPGVVVIASESTTHKTVTAVSDINGSYSLPVYAGTWNVVTATSYSNGLFTNPGLQTATVGASNTTVNFALEPFVQRIYGIVTGPASAIVPGAWAWAVPTVGAFSTSAGANAQGHYEIGVLEDSFTVGASDTTGNYAFLKSSLASITIPPTTRADFGLTTGSYTLSGRVTFAGTSTGAPYVYVLAQDAGALFTGKSDAWTDGQGYYSLKVPAGDFDLTANSTPYHSSARPATVHLGPNLSGLDFSLEAHHAAPTLSAGAVDPASGGTGGQTLKFAVTYTSAENSPPSDVYVMIDSWPRLMTPANPGDTNYADGAVFQYQTTLAVGAHSLWFGALDADLLQARYPASSSSSVAIVTSGVLTGTVKNKVTNAAIAGATVNAYLGGVLQATATSDAGGVYRITSGLPPGAYTVTASRSGYCSVTKSAAITSGTTTYASFFLPPSGTLSGTVKDGNTNAAIAGAAVKAYLSGALKATATTDATGAYRISSELPEGSYSVSAGKTGYVSQTKGGIAVVAGTVSYASFFLAPSGTLSGAVKDRNTNAAIVGATVKASIGSALKATATTDTNGAYRITADLPQGSYTVAAAKSGYATQAKGGIAVAPGTVAYASFFLMPSGTLSGTVKDNVGNAPIAGATVQAYLSGALKATATTDATGGYRIADTLTEGSYAVTASKTNYVTQTKNGVAVTPGAVSYASFFLAAAGTLSGAIKDKVTNAAISGATVKVYLGGALKATVTTDASGGYRVANTLAQGTYSVTASKTGYVTQTKSGIVITPGATSYCSFFLVPIGTLTGTVRDQVTTAVLNGATVKAYIGASLKATTTTDAAGLYTFSIAAATYDVVASKEHYVSRTQTGVIVTGATTTVNLDLAPVSGSYLGSGFMSAYVDPVGNIGLVVRADGTVEGAALTGSPIEDLDIFFTGTVDASNHLTASGTMTSDLGTTDAGAFTIEGTLGNFLDGSAIQGTFTLEGVGSGTWSVRRYTTYPLGCYMGSYSGDRQGTIAIMNFAVDDTVVMIKESGQPHTDLFEYQNPPILVPPSPPSTDYGVLADSSWYYSDLVISGTLGPTTASGTWSQPADPVTLTGTWEASKP